MFSIRSSKSVQALSVKQIELLLLGTRIELNTFRLTTTGSQSILMSTAIIACDKGEASALIIAPTVIRMPGNYSDPI